MSTSRSLEAQEKSCFLQQLIDTEHSTLVQLYTMYGVYFYYGLVQKVMLPKEISYISNYGCCIQKKYI